MTKDKILRFRLKEGCFLCNSSVHHQVNSNLLIHKITCILKSIFIGMINIMYKIVNR